MEKKLLSKNKIILLLILLISFVNNSFSQVEIASQRFHNGNSGYQYTVADKDGVWAPPSQTITTHVGTDNWDYTATTSNGIIRVVNTDITDPASDLYCLQIKNYWNDNPTVQFADIDITNYVNVTFSIAYQSLGDPDVDEDLILDYSYFDGGSWVNTTVTLIEGSNANMFGVPLDTRMFNVSFPDPNPHVVTIPDTATAFRATISSSFVNGSDGTDNYYIDDVILSGDATTTAPVANCQGDFSIELDAFGNASITTADIDNGSTVYIGTMSLSIDKSDFTCADLGSNVITLTVDDGTQTATCTTTVTVNGYTGAMQTPTIPDTTTFCSYTATPPADISYQCNIVSPTTSDTTTFTIPGNYSITWTYYDAVSGSSGTSVQNITLDNLSVPTGITVTNIGPDSATISWDEQLGVESYEIQYKKNNLINWDVVTSTTNTIDLTLLDQLTLYDVRVAAVCSGSSSAFTTIENFTTTGHDYCVPDVTNFNTNNYIRRVRFGTLTPSIDNTSTYSNGYDNYTATDIADLYKNETYTITIDRYSSQSWQEMGYAVWIDFNGDGDFEDAGEDVWRYTDANNTTNANQVTGDITIPTYAVNGETVMRVATRRYWYPDNPCDGNFDGQRGEVEDYTLNLQIRPDAPQEIDVTGNGNLIVDDAGVGQLSIENNTDFGNYDVYEVPYTKTYRITNNGADPLTLTGSPLVQFISNTGDFTLTQPAISVLAIGESTTFTVTFDPTTVGTKSATIRILNDDVDATDSEDDYTFYIQGEAVKTFPDTDGDGVPDNIDGDDDNDGLLDSTEDSACKVYSYATQVETVFLNETFGSGYDRINVGEASAGSTTTYCYEDGTGSCNGSNNLNDGSYTIYYRAGNGDGTNQTPNGEVASWADQSWYTGFDHTDDAIDGAEPGRMLLINADYDPGIFYEATINGVTPGVEVVYGFSVINLDRTDTPCIDGCPGGASWDDNPRNRPEVLIAVYDPNGNALIPTTTSGLVAPTDPSNPNGDWVTVETTFTTTSSQFTIQLINSQDGGAGNDLAIDDIYVKQILCDQDGDGVADSIDLDNDNDGIPNVVELGLADGDKDATLFGDGWVDANGNGVHDSYEGGVPMIDTDGDGIPDYVDADSDNDGIFDAVEYDGYGDVDVDGDGLGDGSDASNLIFDDEADGDGLLGIIDGNDLDADDLDHGSAGYATPLDSDSDGIPDYLEVDSNNDGVYDIEETIYAGYDVDGDGIIDGSTDIDQDGILDSFDTNTSAFGSPRDLDDKYTLYFDGRNDYISENVPVIAGWTSSTLMAWVKIVPGASGQRRIVGQDNFYLTVNNDGTASAVSGGTTLSSTTTLPENVWVHVAASYNNADGNFVLYVNGAEEAIASAGSLGSGTTDLTIGRRPGVSGEENVLTSEYFEGEIDEVRVFDAGLSEEEIQKMVYQELDETGSFVSGKIIPSDISALAGSSLQRYYKMDRFAADITTEQKGVSSGAKLYNIKDIYYQTAPLPYVTTADGSWTTEGTWLHGDVWDIEDTASNKDWIVVKVSHDITASHDIKTAGLLIDSGRRLTVQGDHLVENSWYFELDGTLDLMDDSQLVQTVTSDLVTSADGKVLRRQEGTSSAYWYNYWSSPVGVQAATSLSDNNGTTNNVNNTDFSLNMLKDGTGTDIIFTSGYTANGSNLSTYWLYTYINGLTYWDWEQINTSIGLNPGVGYTQKGTGAGGPDQQYIFEGKPNNGTILIDVTDVGGAGSVTGASKTEYLLGNPYASALDIHKFIDDNIGVIDGTIQLWQQWSGSSHNLNEYNGGYAQVNKLGSTRAYQFVGYYGAHNGSQDGTIVPSRYLPVGQGFITEIVADGQVEFNNSQRVFIKEADADGSYNNGSTFSKSGNSKSSKGEASKAIEEEDSMQKIRLEFSSISGPETRRELLLGFSDYTTDAFDYGYDARCTESNNNDLNLSLEGGNYNMQAYSAITSDKVVPLNFKSSGNNSFEIKITELEDVDEHQEIYLRDNLTGMYFDLTQDTGYSFTSEQGKFNERFEVVFQNESQSLSTEEVLAGDNFMYYQNPSKTFYAKQLTTEVKNLMLINMRGQSVLELDNVSRTSLESGIRFDNIATGTYVVCLKTETNQVLTKKIVIN
ncbi:choice-of-anchor D domain-containing protein [Flaviramulus sp. BrNp1-15]|uniref:LamG-like jellyroll fold domain-containing protein n=1 Tax=Flaviramulus sp. BrNp1-15 TaxID=2916754 RepID=UPI001EE81B5B|nr:LamG-like jellyroll fold domain-containing protein [Flaviramulus sp. BrNp1-15]ULC59917.1 choice-of-anchor D domain-containing protein [Flaviramulus sp. BrNp1-15]